MKSFASVLVGAILAGFVAAKPLPNSPANEDVPYPHPPPEQARPGQQVWALIRTRAINEDETIPLNEWVAVSEDYHGFETKSLITHPINDIVIVDVQPVNGEEWIDASKYACFVDGDDFSHPINFSTFVTDLDGADGSEQFPVNSYTCGLA